MFDYKYYLMYEVLHCVITSQNISSRFFSTRYLNEWEFFFISNRWVAVFYGFVDTLNVKVLSVQFIFYSQQNEESVCIWNGVILQKYVDP